MQISFAVTTKLISAFIFATRIVQFLYFLIPKFPASSHLLCLYSLVYVEPVRKLHCWVSHGVAHIITAELCGDLVAPEEGFVSCMYDEDGLNICNVTCNEGFTHSLRYKTQFQCDTYGTSGWPEKEDIPKCVGKPVFMVIGVSLNIGMNFQMIFFIIIILFLSYLRTGVFIIFTGRYDALLIVKHFHNTNYSKEGVLVPT